MRVARDGAMQHFDRNETIYIGLVGTVNCRHAAFGNFFNQHIRPKLCSNHRPPTFVIALPLIVSLRHYNRLTTQLFYIENVNWAKNALMAVGVQTCHL